MTEPSLRALPRVDVLVEAAHALARRYGRGPVTDVVRAVLDDARRSVLEDSAPVPDQEALLAQVATRLQRRRPGPPREVINATGVVVHTNLGRAPLSAQARAAVETAAGYCDLEYDLETGTRGSRDARLEPLIAEACGAQAALAVNNAAAALVLVLATLAPGRDVLVSRGELVEIGGSFRLPEIMAASTARLVEVGTTNKTSADDYRAGEPALLLKVHRSNFRITGFTAEPTLAELAAVARERGVPLVHDVGSGLLAASDEPWLRDEPTMRGSLEAGAELVLCSGDKLLGGPQAGLLAGRRDLVARCRRHPLARALRLDKLRIAALVATLEAHLRGTPEALPVWAALTADAAVLRDRVQRLASHVEGTIVDGTSLVGGGSVPDAAVPSPQLRVDCADAQAVAGRLRAGSPPVVVRVADAAIWVDLRAVPPEADALLAHRLDDALLR